MAQNAKVNEPVGKDLGGSLFATSIGLCGITWSRKGLTSVHQPGATPARTRSTVRAAGGVAVTDILDAPATVQDAAARIAALLAGSDDDLLSIRLDETGLSPFTRSVFAATRHIPPGSTATYGEIAHDAAPGPGLAARAVGRALARCPFAFVVPCHRVVAANGRLGGYGSGDGAATKMRLLLLEARGRGAASMPPFDLEVAVEHLSAADPLIASAIQQVGSCDFRLRPLGTTVSALCQSIVSQQLHGKAAASIYARLCTLFPRPLAGPTARGLLQLSDEELRRAGLSGSKAAAMRDLAHRALAGEIPDMATLAGMDDAAVIEALTAVRGIGQWTVEMLLIFRLGRPDVLPIDDFGVRHGFATLQGVGSVTPKQLAAHGERWRPYCSVASWYLWRIADLA